MKMSWPDKDFRYGRWIKIKENVEMLRCPYCECQVIREYYESAIGTNGIRFCPYCGEDMWSKGDDEYEGNL